MSPPGNLWFVIKVCGITNEEDARFAVEVGANALGFNFYRKSPRYVTAGRAHEIVSRVSGQYLKVGIFVEPTESAIKETVAAVPLDIVQVYGDSILGLVDCRIWKAGAAAVLISRAMEFASNEDVEAYVLDASTAGHGGSGETFDWTIARGFPHRAIIAGGLDGSNVAEAIRATLPWGVDACSRLESAPGKKNMEKVREFVQAALKARSRYLQETML
jgi:phosphoribosylanthranilate isomerase